MSRYTIDEQSLHRIGDAIRDMRKTADRLTPGQMPDAIRSIYTPYHHEADRPLIQSEMPLSWHRPDAWPDLDALPLPDDGTNCVYLTIDNTNPQLNCNYIRFYHTGSCPCYVDYGHVENGVYIVDSTDSGANTWTSPLHLFTPDDPEYPVIRLRSDKATAFRQNSIAAVTKANSPNGIAVAATNCDMQYVLEVRGAVPTMTNFSSSNGNPVYGGRFCKRIKLLHCQKITSMAYAFQNNVLCESLELSADQPAQITGSMGSAFTNCMSLHSLDLSMLNVSKATNVSSIFDTCRLLTNLDLSGWQITSSCTSLSSMFRYCIMLSFEHIPLEQWDVSGATTLASCFAYCYHLEELDISAWHPTKATSMGDMFSNARCLKTLKLPAHPASLLTNFSNLCANCNNLEGELDLSLWNPNAVANCYSAFSSCFHLEKVNLGNMKVVTNTTSTSTASGASSMFNACYSLREILWDMSQCDFTEGGNVNSFYANCYNLTTPLDWSFFKGLKYATSFTPWSNCYKVPSIRFSDDVHLPKVTSLASLFNGWHSVKRIDISAFRLDVPITSMANMFTNCRSVEEIIMPVLDTSAVTTINGMFSYCYKLRSVPDAVKVLDLPKCTNCGAVFQEAASLTDIDLSGWRNTHPTTISSLFSNCNNLRRINCAGWDTSALTGTHSGMFSGIVYTTLDQTGWNVSMTALIPDSNFLVEWYPPTISVAFKISSCYSLSDASLERLVQALPKRSSAATITMGAPLIKRFSAEQIAAITGKGWTIA